MTTPAQPSVPHAIVDEAFVTYCRRCHEVDPDFDTVCRVPWSRWVTKEGKSICKVCRGTHE